MCKQQLLKRGLFRTQLPLNVHSTALGAESPPCHNFPMNLSEFSGEHSWSILNSDVAVTRTVIPHVPKLRQALCSLVVLLLPESLGRCGTQRLSLWFHPILTLLHVLAAKTTLLPCSYSVLSPTGWWD